MAMTYGPTLFAQAANDARLKPFPAPSGQHVSRLYQSTRACSSARAPIAASARSSAAAITPRPARRRRSCRCCMRKKNFTLKTECEVIKINLDSDGKRAVSVTYVDARARSTSSPPT